MNAKRPLPSAAKPPSASSEDRPNIERLAGVLTLLLGASHLAELQSLLVTQIADLIEVKAVALICHEEVGPRILAGHCLKGSWPFACEVALPLEDAGTGSAAWPISLICYRNRPFGVAERDQMAALLAPVARLWHRLGVEATQRASLRRNEFIVAQLAEQLHHHEQVKVSFLATMSHELRTPLNVVLGFASLLADEAFGQLNAQQANACHKVIESTERLTLLINDLLDVRTLDAGNLRFHFAPVDLAELLNGVADNHRPLAAEKGLLLSLDLLTPMPVIVTDAPRLRQVFTHLVDNALKFTAPGGRIGIRCLPVEAAGGVVIGVWDTGIGIPEDVQHRLFERFYQVDNSSTRRYGGTGLGLALVKEFIERVGGTVSVESQVGKGSMFVVRLPLKADDTEELVG